MSFSGEAPQVTFFEAVGGHDTFRALVRNFYAGVAEDDVLRPMYPEADLEPAIERLTLFLEQYWGGPTTYSDNRGHPRLRMRHAPFAVDSRGIAEPAAGLRLDALGLPRTRRLEHGQHPRLITARAAAAGAAGRTSGPARGRGPGTPATTGRTGAG